MLKREKRREEHANQEAIDRFAFDTKEIPGIRRTWSTTVFFLETSYISRLHAFCFHHEKSDSAIKRPILPLILDHFR